MIITKAVPMKNSSRFWISRLAIAIVVFFNVQCAFVFLLWPHPYAPSFDLSGTTGRVVIQAVAILFLMWNVPYVFALLDPVRHFHSLGEAVIMQLIGGVGETLLFFSVEAASVFRSSIGRFMLFDWGGLILLMAAWFLAKSLRNRPGEPAAT